MRPHSFLSLYRERKESPRRQKKPAPFRFRRGGENSISAGSFFLSESRPLRWVAFRLINIRKERELPKPEVRPVPPSCDSSFARLDWPAPNHLSAGNYAPHAILMMAGRQRLADTQHPVEVDGSVRPSQTVTQRSGHSLERKKEPADMELSPPRRKRNAAGFF